MPLAIDTSALLRRHLADAGTALVHETMAAEPIWVASALVRVEIRLALHRLSLRSGQLSELWQRFRADWDSFWVVPLDDRCLTRATELGSEFGLDTADALHLAAVDRLGRPTTYLTFDSRQIPAALALGLNVISPLDSPLDNHRTGSP